ncbi:Protein kinase domain [Sesbania bispinosa]|nr:Protein kinase domain [Sesbania bispinosa]
MEAMLFLEEDTRSPGLMASLSGSGTMSLPVFGNQGEMDIKGVNILVDPNGEIKLADFGVAKHASLFDYVNSKMWLSTFPFNVYC